jgi:uncharacterized protein with HEPN domain
MPRDCNVYLDDILQAIARIQEYVGASSYEEFVKDTKCFDAVVRNLEVIGEATKAIPGAIRLGHPEVDWKRMAGLRDILIHQYFGVDARIIWDIIVNKLPALETQMRTILNG